MFKVRSFFITAFLILLLIMGAYLILPATQKSADPDAGLADSMLVGIAYPEGEKPEELPDEFNAYEKFGDPLAQAETKTVVVYRADSWTSTGNRIWIFSLDSHEPSYSRPIDSTEILLSDLGGSYRLSWHLVEDLEKNQDDTIRISFITPKKASGGIGSIKSYSVMAARTMISALNNPGSEACQTELAIIVLPFPRIDRHIAIYTGQGADAYNLEAVKNFLDRYEISWDEIDESTLTAGINLNELYDAIWFVGGFSEEYRFYVSNHGRIVDYVDQGGVFIGNCAGAYYASSFMSWKDRIIDYPLNLFGGYGIGPLGKLAPWGKLTKVNLNSEHPANEGFGTTINLLYLDGPYFAPVEQESDIIGRYMVNEQPAVINIDYGAGKVLLFGPHPELGLNLEADLYNVTGGDGAQWPWLYSVITHALTN